MDEVRWIEVIVLAFLAGFLVRMLSDRQARGLDGLALAAILVDMFLIMRWR